MHGMAGKQAAHGRVTREHNTTTHPCFNAVVSPRAPLVRPSEAGQAGVLLHACLHDCVLACQHILQAALTSTPPSPGVPQQACKQGMTYSSWQPSGTNTAAGGANRRRHTHANVQTPNAGFALVRPAC